jgi:aspartyl-tRNA(Asn)/glutamyl-tRNA(Gln) amidotransferase subunit C
MDNEGIARLAALARLQITEDERRQFAAQLTDILRYVEQIQAVDTSAVEAETHPLAPPTAWRDDTPVASLPTDAGLANAPDADRSRGLFRVPKVLG